MASETTDWAARAVAALERLAARPATPWAVLGFALGLRLVGLDKGIWLDEAFSLDVSLRDTLPQVVRALRWMDHPPLFFLLLHLVSRLSRAEPVLRLLPLVFGLGLVAVVQRWAARTSPTAGLLAGLLAATLPFLLRFSHELRGYSLLALAVTAACAAADRIRSEPGGTAPYLVLGGSLAVAALTHHVGAFALAPVGWLLLGRERPRPAPRLLPLVAALAAPVAGALAVGVLEAAGTKSMQTWWMPAPTPSRLGAFLITFVTPSSSSWLPFGEQPAADRALAALAAALATVALTAGARSGALRPALAASAYLAALVAVSWLVVPVLWNRTALPALPLLVVAVAIGAATARSPWLRAWTSLGLVGLSLGFAGRWLGWEARRPLEPWRAVSERILALRKPPDLVYFSPHYGSPPLRRYLARAAPPPKIFEVRSGDERQVERGATLLARTRGGGPSTVWLVMRLEAAPRASPETLRSLFVAVARERGRRPVRALMIETLEAPIYPGQLASRRSTTEALLLAFGEPAETVDHGQWVELYFPPARPAG